MQVPVCTFLHVLRGSSHGRMSSHLSICWTQRAAPVHPNERERANSAAGGLTRCCSDEDRSVNASECTHAEATATHRSLRPCTTAPIAVSRPTRLCRGHLGLSPLGLPQPSFLLFVKLDFGIVPIPRGPGDEDKGVHTTASFRGRRRYHFASPIRVLDPAFTGGSSPLLRYACLFWRIV